VSLCPSLVVVLLYVPIFSFFSHSLHFLSCCYCGTGKRKWERWDVMICTYTWDSLKTFFLPFPFSHHTTITKNWVRCDILFVLRLLLLLLHITRVWLFNKEKVKSIPFFRYICMTKEKVVEWMKCDGMMMAYLLAFHKFSQYYIILPSLCSSSSSSSLSVSSWMKIRKTNKKGGRGIYANWKYVYIHACLPNVLYVPMWSSLRASRAWKQPIHCHNVMWVEKWSRTKNEKGKPTVFWMIWQLQEKVDCKPNPIYHTKTICNSQLSPIIMLYYFSVEVEVISEDYEFISNSCKKDPSFFFRPKLFTSIFWYDQFLIQ